MVRRTSDVTNVTKKMPSNSSQKRVPMAALTVAFVHYLIIKNKSGLQEILSYDYSLDQPEMHHINNRYGSIIIINSVGCVLNNDQKRNERVIVTAWSSDLDRCNKIYKELECALSNYLTNPKYVRLKTSDDIFGSRLIGHFRTNLIGHEIVN